MFGSKKAFMYCTAYTTVKSRMLHGSSKGNYTKSNVDVVHYKTKYSCTLICSAYIFGKITFIVESLTRRRFSSLIRRKQGRKKERKTNDRGE